MSTYMVNYPAKQMQVEVVTDDFEAYINRLAETKKSAVDFDGLSFNFWTGFESGSGRFILPDDSVEEFTVQQVYNGGFVITEDLITESDEDTYAVGRIGPMPLAPSLIKTLEEGTKKGYQFILKDDDDITYWKGRAYDPTGEYDESWVYEIYKWGRAMGGTTQLIFPRCSKLNIS